MSFFLLVCLLVGLYASGSNGSTAQTHDGNQTTDDDDFSLAILPNNFVSISFAVPVTTSEGQNVTVNDLQVVLVSQFRTLVNASLRSLSTVHFVLEYGTVLNGSAMQKGVSSFQEFIGVTPVRQKVRRSDRSFLNTLRRNAQLHDVRGLVLFPSAVTLVPGVPQTVYAQLLSNNTTTSLFDGFQSITIEAATKDLQVVPSSYVVTTLPQPPLPFTLTATTSGIYTWRTRLLGSNSSSFLLSQEPTVFVRLQDDIDGTASAYQCGKYAFPAEVTDAHALVTQQFEGAGIEGCGDEGSCCAVCLQMSACKQWTYRLDQKLCLLFRDYGVYRNSSNQISGNPPIIRGNPVLSGPSLQQLKWAVAGCFGCILFFPLDKVFRYIAGFDW